MKIGFIDRLVILFTGRYHKAIPLGVAFQIDNLAAQCYPGEQFDCADLRVILRGISKPYIG